MKTVISSLLCFVVISLVAQPKLHDRTDSLNYFFGLTLGYSLQSAPFPADASVIAQGLAETLEDRSEFDSETAREIFQELNKELAAELANFQEAEEPQNQDVGGDENLNKGRAFLAENGQREEVTTTESGLQFESLTMGEGPKPTATSTVEVHYEGTLIDGTIFDSSYERGESISFPLDRVISGWTEGVQQMPVGSIFKFYIPSELAYGPRDAGSIPPNSVLVFKIELLGIE